MSDYHVEWSIDIFGSSSPKEAAEEALRIMRDEKSLATVFTVIDEAGNRFLVDLLADGDQMVVPLD